LSNSFFPPIGFSGEPFFPGFAPLFCWFCLLLLFGDFIRLQKSFASSPNQFFPREDCLRVPSFDDDLPPETFLPLVVSSPDFHPPISTPGSSGFFAPLYVLWPQPLLPSMTSGFYPSDWHGHDRPSCRSPCPCIPHLPDIRPSFSGRPSV